MITLIFNHKSKHIKRLKNLERKVLTVVAIVFLQVESPLRNNEFLIKKICEHAKVKKCILAWENLNTIRDYSWAPEIVKGVYCVTKIKTQRHNIV